VRTFLLSMLVALSSTPARAEAIDEVRFVAAVSTTDPRLARLAAEIATARAEVVGASARPNPTLAFDREVPYVDGSGQPTNYLRLELPLDEAAARAALKGEPEPPGRITYLKEQAWKTDFGTVAVTERDLQDGVRAAGEIRPVAGKEARLTAPAAGRVSLVEPAPLLGMPVKKGQVLASISPRASGGTDRPTLAADVGAAEAEAQAAKAQLERAQRLVTAQAAPPRTVEEATTRLQIAEARLTGARGRLAQFEAGASGAGGGRVFQVRAPIDGTLTETVAASGQGVDEGQHLFTVIDLDRVWLVAKVFEPDVPRVEAAQRRRSSTKRRARSAARSCSRP
jgi:multidrug efflux pump subunit AcrA (membrane-fusion protein)